MAGLFDSLPTGLVLLTFVQYLIAFCSRPETACNVIACAFMGPVVPDKHVKFRDRRLNRFREIPSEAVVCRSFFRYNFR